MSGPYPVAGLDTHPRLSRTHPPSLSHYSAKFHAWCASKKEELSGQVTGAASPASDRCIECAYYNVVTPMTGAGKRKCAHCSANKGETFSKLQLKLQEILTECEAVADVFARVFTGE